jgi:hypothetical protein
VYNNGCPQGKEWSDDKLRALMLLDGHRLDIDYDAKTVELT